MIVRIAIISQIRVQFLFMKFMIEFIIKSI